MARISIRLSESCTRAATSMHRQWSSVNSPIGGRAASCAEPSRMDCGSAGNQFATQSENASAVAATGAEKPAKMEVKPLVKPQLEAYALVR
jgi:hypothetical protein